MVKSLWWLTYHKSHVEDKHCNLKRENQATVTGPAYHLDFGTKHSGMTLVNVPVSFAEYVPKLVFLRINTQRSSLGICHAIVRKTLAVIDGEVCQSRLCRI